MSPLAVRASAAALCAVVCLLLSARPSSAGWVLKGGQCVSLNASYDCPFYNSDTSTFPFEVRMYNATTEPRVFAACNQLWDTDLLKVFGETSAVVASYMAGNNADNATLPMQLPRLCSIDNRRTGIWDVETCHLVGRKVGRLPVPLDQFVTLGTLQSRNAFAVFPFSNQSTAGIDAAIAEVKHLLNTNFSAYHYDQGVTWASYSVDGTPAGQRDELWVTMVWPQPELDGDARQGRVVLADEDSKPTAPSASRRLRQRQRRAMDRASRVAQTV